MLQVVLQRNAKNANWVQCRLFGILKVSPTSLKFPVPRRKLPDAANIIKGNSSHVSRVGDNPGSYKHEKEIKIGVIIALLP